MRGLDFMGSCAKTDTAAGQGKQHRSHEF